MKTLSFLKRYYPLLAVIPLSAILISCAVVAETGRRQILLVTPEAEMQLGLTEFEKMKGSIPISRDPEVNALVQRVGKRISAVAPLKNAQWEFVVFDQPKVPNAFCLPGGKVGIYTGILPITQNEGGMATVIGHEVAHAVARHGAERISEGLLLQMGGIALDAAMRNKSQETRVLVQQAYGIGGTVGVMLPHSRSHELEADRIGMIYMARAGYNPREAVEFWKRFAAFNRQHGSSATPEFLRTHPVDEKRIAQLEQLLPQAMEEYEKTLAK
jgi:predicted Zn-dependent protease